MNKRKCSFLICGAVILLVLLSATAWGYEKEIEQLSATMAEKIAAKGKKTVAVVDFTDLEGNVTQLDRFIAEEFSVALASSGKGFRVIDRTHLKSIIKENKLSATGLIDPATARKLGKIAGVDALVTGTLTPFGDNVRVTIKVLDSDTADIIDAAKGNFAKTQAIEELLAKGIDQNNISSPVGRKMPANGSAVASQTVNGILFEAKGCNLSSGSLTCHLIITNQDDDKDIVIFNNHDWSSKTRAFDEMANEYNSSMLEIANKKSRSSSFQYMLVSGVATKLSFTFEGVASDINSLSLLEVSFASFTRRRVSSRLKAKLRDIPVSK